MVTPTSRQHLGLYGRLLVVAAVLGAVVNALHPIATGDLTDTARGIADAGTWIALHVAISLTLLLLAAGLVGTLPATKGSAGEAPSQVALLFTAVGVSVALGALAIDGISLKVLADAWSSSGPAAATARLDSFITIKHVNTALWNTAVLVFFGLGILTHGLALRTCGRFPHWVGWGAMAGGALSIASAAIQLPAGGESRLGETLFVGAAAWISLWALAVGLLWWRVAAPMTEARRTAPNP